MSCVTGRCEVERYVLTIIKRIINTTLEHITQLGDIRPLSLASLYKVSDLGVAYRVSM